MEDLVLLQRRTIERILATPIARGILSGDPDRTQYVGYLVNVSHYAKHSALVISLAGWRFVDRAPALASYYFEHAGEELGHERWALSDLADLGVTEQAVLESSPAPSCAAIVGLEYFTAGHGNPVALLGWMRVLESLGDGSATRSRIASTAAWAQTSRGKRATSCAGTARLTTPTSRRWIVRSPFTPARRGSARHPSRRHGLRRPLCPDARRDRLGGRHVGVSVALAASPEHRRRCSSRRRVYVTELGGTFPESVVANGQLREQVDDVAFNYALLDQGRVVGSLRVADLHRIDATPVIARYRLETLVSRLGLEAFTVAGRLALEPAYRNGGHMLHLVDRAYRDARARGIAYAVSDCSPSSSCPSTCASATASRATPSTIPSSAPRYRCLAAGGAAPVGEETSRTLTAPTFTRARHAGDRLARLDGRALADPVHGRRGAAARDGVPVEGPRCPCGGGRRAKPQGCRGHRGRAVSGRAQLR